MSRDERYFLGLADASGADGVNAVLAAITGTGLHMRARQVRHVHTAYEPPLSRRVRELAAGAPTPVGEVARLGRDTGLAFAAVALDLLKASRIGRGRIAAIGVQGPRLAHDPPDGPGQVGAALRAMAPAVVAQRTGLAVVADFEQGDLAAGGRGGPLSAWPDYVLLHHPAKARVLVDLGCIARITFLPAEGLAGDTLAFDAGPGTVVIDALAARLFDQPYDADGSIAARGRPAEPLLNELLAERFFHLPPPRTAQAAQWGGAFIDRLMLLAEKYRTGPADLVATASELTVRAIVRAIGDLTQRPHEVILRGGGARNIYLAMRLRQMLTPASTIGLERFDIDAVAATALGVALLTAARLDRVPANIPQVTGSAGPALLGSVTESTAGA